MSRKILFSTFFIMTLALSACNLAIPVIEVSLPTSTASIPSVPIIITPQPTGTNTQIPGSSLEATATSQVITATLAPSNTPMPTVTSSAALVPILASANYIDDRSTAWQVIVSYYNAINRQEYSRAYSYWTDPTTTLGSFSSFAAGYQDTGSVDLVFGQISADAYMSQVDYTIPVILKVTAKNSTHTNYASCYVVHETSPDVLGAPPFIPMSISRGSALPSDNNAPDATVLASACSGYPAGGMTNSIAEFSSLSIDKNNFLDNLSGPIETVSSFLNALNLKQYVRAYSYFQNPATFPGSYNSYAAGYSDTDVITVTFGTPRSEGAAGSVYYKVPLATKVITTSSAIQTFVGCYTLRLAHPSVQINPPFRSLGIVSGKFIQVANSTDINTLLPSACN